MSVSFKHKEACVIIPRAFPLSEQPDTLKRQLDSLGIKKGSGIVSVPFESGFKIYYEGNIHSAANLDSFKERILCSAGRAMTSYPTTAFCYFDKADYENLFCAIGYAELVSGKIEVLLINELKAKEWEKQYRA